MPLCERYLAIASITANFVISDVFVFVFGGINDKFMDTSLKEASNKCLNSIERYTVEYNRWDMVDLKTYQKLSFMSHLVAIHVPWDKDRSLIVGG